MTVNNNKNQQKEELEDVVSEHLIVGLGASAGGLEALQQFFGSMSGTSDLSFVVIQHLSPNYKSLLAEILSKHTSMTVTQAENETEVLPNHVYLIPPNNNMVLKNNKLYLTEYVHRNANHPIDLFFSSLAEEKKEQSIAVVFSGTGSDGTNGVKTIKEYGGLVMVQDPSSAKFDGMPKNAIHAGVADFILTPQGIAEEILNFISYPSIIQPGDDVDHFSDEELLLQIYSHLRRICGIDFTYYKRTTVTRRIERRMGVTHQENPEDYLRLLESNEEESRILGKEILIGVTNFFRDGDYFEQLKEKAMYPILTHSLETDPIRVWVAGCSTGEEAYSIAILLHEAMDELELHRDVKVFATDVDAKAVEMAGKGMFTESILEDLSPERLSKFFQKKNDLYEITKDIRRMIIFAPHNIFQDPPFGKLDLISCRNVMIYFQPVLQKKLFGIFHSALKDKGFLFLGKSETVGEFSDVFDPVCIAEKIYVHTTSGKLPEGTPIRVFEPMNHSPQTGYVTDRGNEEAEKTIEDTYYRFLEAYLPPAVILNEKNDVIHFFGAYDEFLHIGAGKATFNIFNLVDDDLSFVISTALNKCRKEHTDVTYAGVMVQGALRQHYIDLIIQPIHSRKGADTGLVSIVFNEQNVLEPVGQIEQYDINKTAAQRIVDLELELLDTQENLKRTVGELETVNEELQAANEELLTANEELQSSNEELQSVNEELYTVNSEYQHKLDELMELTNDLSNFLSSTMIGILFVDNNLSIRKFTDYIGREFKLMEQDIGRPLQIIAHYFPAEDILLDAKEVLKTLLPIDREVVANDNKKYIERIAPYRTTDNVIKGLVITIIDQLGEMS